MTTIYITNEIRQQVIPILTEEGSAKLVTLDFKVWADDNSALTSATWAVESGSATISGQALSSSVASAKITTTSAGKSRIKVTASNATYTKVIRLSITAKGTETSDY